MALILVISVTLIIFKVILLHATSLPKNVQWPSVACRSSLDLLGFQWTKWFLMTTALRCHHPLMKTLSSQTHHFPAYLSNLPSHLCQPVLHKGRVSCPPTLLSPIPASHLPKAQFSTCFHMEPFLTIPSTQGPFGYSQVLFEQLSMLMLVFFPSRYLECPTPCN